MGVETAQFAPERASADELRAWYELFVEVSEAEFPDNPVPPYDSYVRQLRRSSSSQWSRLRWEARDGGRLVGTATATFPIGENSGYCDMAVRVTAPDRRGGVGTGLLRAALPEIRERRCRTIGGEVKADSDGEKWAQALGFHPVLSLTEHRLDLTTADPAQWQVETPPGFRLRRWADTAPDDLVEGFAQALTAMADQPIGEATFTYPVWTVERLRKREADSLKAGQSRRYVVAVDERTGTVAGFTEMVIDAEQKTHGHQGDTGVLSEFRGSGLGLAVKSSMMRWLTADLPHLEQVETMTASENTHMIRVNSQLGYQATYTLLSVESDVDALEAALHGTR
ncbi:GNAT family N-acetyltransferase [Streptacidiphilus fuscans]|uniref:GNAT family N-acetyltransferase n=1 Tax=Streptacidiphilus fuscans TaxID=2789292 RepID=A0A931BCY9_9ACTN|nr:GNAT family N-acetyltransferase [Streptacidiphilus fuscans]MBF9071933.1 GNAT family N-acetyltransferase [Streptacidiphilus fuscans]